MFKKLSAKWQLSNERKLKDRNLHPLSDSSVIVTTNFFVILDEFKIAYLNIDYERN